MASVLRSAYALGQLASDLVGHELGEVISFILPCGDLAQRRGQLASDRARPRAGPSRCRYAHSARDERCFHDALDGSQAGDEDVVRVRGAAQLVDDGLHDRVG